MSDSVRAKSVRLLFLYEIKYDMESLILAKWWWARRINGTVTKNYKNEDVVTILLKYNNYENEEDHKSKKRQVLHLCLSPTYYTKLMA